VAEPKKQRKRFASRHQARFMLQERVTAQEWSVLHEPNQASCFDLKEECKNRCLDTFVELSTKKKFIMKQLPSFR
jgi:hypothetical protein